MAGDLFAGTMMEVAGETLSRVLLVPGLGLLGLRVSGIA